MTTICSYDRWDGRRLTDHVRFCESEGEPAIIKQADDEEINGNSIDPIAFLVGYDVPSIISFIRDTVVKKVKLTTTEQWLAFANLLEFEYANE